MKKANLILLSLVVIVASCQSSNEDQSKIKPKEKIAPTLDLAEVTNSPFQNIQKEPLQHRVSADLGGTIELKGGSEITIPENAFVDRNGEVVTGDVDILITEFNSLGDIILGGVNMKYDSAGVSNDFVSAGMFHIDGEKDGDPIEIAQGKSIEYSHASNIDDLEDTPCFNFYKMDKDQNWGYLDTKKAQGNPKYVEQERYERPTNTLADDLVIELDMKGQKRFLNENGSVLWKYAGSRPDTVDKVLLNEITAKNVDIVKTDDHQLSYQLKATIEGKQHVYPVEPVLMGGDLEKAMAEFESKMKQIEKSDETVRNYLQKRYRRSYAIPSFGMYNWDIIYKASRMPLVVETSTIHGIPQELCTFYLISKSENLTIAYSGKTLKSFSYNPNADNHIIAINPNDQVAVLRSKDFYDQIRNVKDNKARLQFEELEGQVASQEEFLHFVDQL